MADFERFFGTNKYIADEDLMRVVNAAVVLGRPLLVKGEPGTGKTLLAHAVAEALDMELFSWHIKSTTKAVDGLYTYDVVQRLNDSRFGGGDISNIGHYIKLGQLAQAFKSPQRVVVLIDEIDKADLEFPNDLLRELDEMAFFIPETNETIRANHRPVVIITSNAEKELPDAFLRRCVFHYISFPNRQRMERIIRVHHPLLDQELLDVAMTRFFGFRKTQGLRKPPSTSELIDWLAVLVHAGLDPKQVEQSNPFLGVLFKQESDLQAATKKRTSTLY
ncbi:MAG: MoxR family ATPase [Proteobacteria bacterium]|nr:MoxR family ATPase [Pseudomonadota bacterium]